AVVLYLFARDAYRSLANRVLLGCIMGGALGNLVDRIRWGRVVDFIDVGLGSVRWPVFNVADSAVTLGVILLAWNLADPAAPTPISKVHPVPTSRAGERLDRFLTEVERSLSRSAIQQLIDQGCVRVNGDLARASRRVKVGDTIEVTRPRRVPTRLVAEDIPLTVVHEDEALAVILKPAGMVVHPAVGHRTGTLVHALLHRYDALPSSAGLERAGLVHRIDKGTSGLLLIARTEPAHRELARQLEAREVKRVYRALVW